MAAHGLAIYILIHLTDLLKANSFAQPNFKLKILRREMGLKCQKKTGKTTKTFVKYAKKKTIFPVSRFTVQKLRRFSKKMRSHAISRLQLLEALTPYFY